MLSFLYNLITNPYVIAIYILIEFCTYQYLFYKHRKTFRMCKETKEYFEKKYSAFVRKDLDEISLIKTFPMWIFFHLRLIFAGIFIFSYMVFVMIVMIGYKPGSKIGRIRRALTKYPVVLVTRVVYIMVGVLSLDI